MNVYFYLLLTTHQSSKDSDADGGTPVMTILISKYLSISSFCLSLFTLFLTLTILRLCHIQKNQNQPLRSSIYTGSRTNISLDSFDSEGYLRPHTDIDSMYEDIV